MPFLSMPSSFDLPSSAGDPSGAAEGRRREAEERLRGGGKYIISSQNHKNGFIHRHGFFSTLSHTLARPNKLQTATLACSLDSSTATSSVSKQDAVVVGGGIAGLAVSVSLHKLGVNSIVLEQGSALRTGGTSLALFKNGWRVLDSLGVGDELRQNFLPIQGMVMKSDNGTELRSFSFDEEAPGYFIIYFFMRAVERRILLETLANKLPPNTISYSSRVKSVNAQGSDGTLLELEDGRQILAKLVIGCDGVNSPIAKWMGFFLTQNSWGTARSEASQNTLTVNRLSRKSTIFMERVFVPGSCQFPSPRSIGSSASIVIDLMCTRNTDSSQLKKEALHLVKNFPSDLLEAINTTKAESVIETPLGRSFRGLCCARHKIIRCDEGEEAINQAMKEYSEERWYRVFPLTVRASLVGSLVQWDNPLVCALRNYVFIPKLVRLGPFLEHTNFECELIEPEPVVSS
ncbi:hypothetical protein LUZ60_007517 [Juncus effusus]|nr:hypothetical protein LUZ60_007517 [Juncus effusus]